MNYELDAKTFAVEKQKYEENIILANAMGELKKTIRVFGQELDELNSLTAGDDLGQALRRASYHSVFSWIDGVVYQIKQIAFHTQGGYFNTKFSRGEVAFLLDEQYSIKPNGNVKSNNHRKIPTRENVRFSFLMFAKGFGFQGGIEVDGSGWEDFCKSLTIRNRITHPKKHSSLTVDNHEMATIQAAASWFNKQIIQLIAAAEEPVDSLGKSIDEYYASINSKVTQIKKVILMLNELDLEDKKKDEERELAVTLLSELL